MEDEEDEVVGHPAHHGEVGQQDVCDLSYVVEVDEDEDSQGEGDVQYLSVVDVGRDDLGLPGLDTGHHLAEWNRFRFRLGMMVLLTSALSLMQLRQSSRHPKPTPLPWVYLWHKSRFFLCMEATYQPITTKCSE